MPEPTPFEEVEVYDDEPYMWPPERLKALAELAEKHLLRHDTDPDPECDICVGPANLVLGLYDQVKLYHQVGFSEGVHAGYDEHCKIMEAVREELAKRYG